MYYKICYGEISETGRKVWEQEDVSPFDVLIENNEVLFDDSWPGFLGWARKKLHDEVQVDWGSFAWRCTGRDILQLKEDRPRCSIGAYENIEAEKEYGIVFIEMS